MWLQTPLHSVFRLVISPPETSQEIIWTVMVMGQIIPGKPFVFVLQDYQKS